MLWDIIIIIVIITYTNNINLTMSSLLKTNFHNSRWIFTLIVAIFWRLLELPVDSICRKYVELSGRQLETFEKFQIKKHKYIFIRIRNSKKELIKYYSIM